ncbi:alpha/beta fold hydrolase [Leekyejoonella antrihumi]|uniref:alpha/beta fold hydrolase n=1 Tax=Leekyejoonella antrihumi TaxID=1660198 RepID=UPI001C965959|nr:alpha/beta hydrolase [Leekyejoonella antrihumi]
MLEESDWRSMHRDGVELAYAEVGAGERTALLLHGLAGCVEEWKGTLDDLRAQGYRVLALDQRGHGRSTRRPASVTRAAYVEDVVSLIEESGAGPVDLIGQSMGAHTALLVAAERPDLIRSLVLVEGGVGGGGPEATAPVARWLHSWPVPFGDRDAFAEFFGGSPRVARAWADGLNVRVDGLWPRWDADVLEAALAQVHAIAWWKAWERVSAPTLVVRGAEGRLSGPEVDEMLRRGRDVHAITVAAAGHDLHLEAPRAWLDALHTFLSQRG